MKKFSASFNNIIRLSIVELKRLIGNPLKFLIFFLIFCVLLLASKSYFLRVQPKMEIGIVNEDDSNDVKVMLANLEKSKLDGSVNFSYFNENEAELALDKNKVMAVFIVEDGTSDALNSGEKARIRLLVKNNDFETQYLIKYMERLLDLFNESQTRAMLYLDTLIEAEDDVDVVYEKFSKLSDNIFFAFLTRGSVINQENGIRINFLANIINVFTIVFIIMAVFFSYFDYYDDMKNGRITRLLKSGYKKFEYSLSRLFTSLIINFLFMFLINVFVWAFFPEQLGQIIANRFLTIMIFAVFLSLLYELLLFTDFMKGYFPAVIISLLTIFSTVFTFSAYLPSIVQKLININFISIFYGLLKGHSFNLFSGFILLIYLLIIIVLKRLLMRRSFI